MLKVGSSNIKTFVDGNRFILVVENANCNDELAKRIRAFISELAVDAPFAQIEGLEPPPKAEIENTPFIPEGREGNEQPDAPMTQEELNGYRFSNGKYKGLTFSEILKKFGCRAAIDIYLLSKELPARIAPHMKMESRRYILADLNKRNSALDKRKDIQDFIFAYRQIANDVIVGMKNDQGAGSVEDFVRFSDDEMLRQVYQTLIDYLKETI